MPHPATGTLRTWHDDRGFGFIAPTHGGAEVFVHISAFPRDGSRPTVGEKVSYEIGRGRDGKPLAVKVVRQAVGATRPTPRPEAKPASRTSPLLGTLALVGVLAVVGTWGYKRFSASQHRQALAAEPAPVSSRSVPSPVAAAPTPAAATYRCDGRTHCSQMTSCAEATWFINHCPGTTMDGNHDGVPCEQQWCTGR